MIIPQNIADFTKQFAAEMGVTAGHARKWMNSQYTKQDLVELDARLRARASLAELEAARSVTEKDIQWLADDDDPREGLDFIIRHRSYRILKFGDI